MKLYVQNHPGGTGQVPGGTAVRARTSFTRALVNEIVGWRNGRISFKSFWNDGGQGRNRTADASLFWAGNNERYVTEGQQLSTSAAPDVVQRIAATTQPELQTRGTESSPEYPSS